MQTPSFTADALNVAAEIAKAEGASRRKESGRRG